MYLTLTLTLHSLTVHSSSQGACVKIETNIPATLDNGCVYMYNRISTTVILMGCAVVTNIYSPI